MNSLPLETRLFYILLWMEADDSGWLRWDTAEINADLYPNQPMQERIETWAGELQGARRLHRYRCGHAFIPHLPEHQRLAGPEHQVHTILREHAQKCRTRKPPRKPATPRNSPPGKVKVKEGIREGKGSKGGVGDTAKHLQQVNGEWVATE